ncbi:MAG: 1-deoxy-D-xylulose-5-phosphate synthase [Monoglobales bacterium]
MDLLYSVNSPKDLKKLSPSQLKKYISEAREYITETVSKTGGHLASNLGVMELVTAMHYVFNSPRDKLIFDVGHQCYMHKLITGRRDEFETLRTFGGISGFPKRSESPHDVFNTGHSSTSVSAAIGMARAAHIRDEHYHVVSLVGDGALNGGMIYEAMADAGHSKDRLVIIVNDNEMAISKNVGAVSYHLSNIRTTHFYNKLKNATIDTFKNFPGITSVLSRCKNGIKSLFLKNNMFESLGFRYFGPFDGHNLDKLINVFSHVKNIDDNCVIHVKTTKGKGYAPAEEKPVLFHSMPPSETSAASARSFSSVMGAQLVNIAKENKSVAAITAAMGTATGLDMFKETFPDRFFDVGMAESHAVTMAAGMATLGIIPVVAIYSTFLQRAYDQILHDICLQNLHVVLCLDRAGIVGEDGETHQGIYDTAFLGHMPNMTILAPSDYSELEAMLYYAVNEHSGPVTIRYPKSPVIDGTHSSPITYHKGEISVPGGDVLILSAGDMLEKAIEVRKILRQDRISAMVVNLRFLKPLDAELILSNTVGKNLIVTMENSVLLGSASENIIALLHESGITTPVLPFAFPDTPIPHGSVEMLFEKYGLSPQQMADEIKTHLKGKIR